MRPVQTASAALAVALLSLAAPAVAADALPHLGVALDAGVPGGAGLLLQARAGPLRLSAGPMWSGIGYGAKGGLALAPFAWAVAPVLELDGGWCPRADLSLLAGNGLPDDLEPVLSHASYWYAGALAGLDLGSPRRFSFYLRAGLARLQVRAPRTSTSDSSAAAAARSSSATPPSAPSSPAPSWASSSGSDRSLVRDPPRPARPRRPAAPRRLRPAPRRAGARDRLRHPPRLRDAGDAGSGTFATDLTYDLGADLDVLDDPDFTSSLRLQRLELAVSPGSGAIDLAGVEALSATVLPPAGSSLPEVVAAQYIRGDAPSATSLAASSLSDANLVPYLTDGKAELHLEASGDHADRALDGHVTACFLMEVSVDYGKKL